MKIELKKLFAGKKRILAVIIGVVFISALAVGIFFTNQKLTERKKAEEQKIAREKEQEAKKREKEQEEEKKEAEKNAEKAEEQPKEKKGPWTDYTAFIEDVKKGVEDDFRNISVEELDISPVFGGKEADMETYVLGYYLEDLDSDGMDELFFGLKDKWYGDTTILDIYTMKDGYVFHVASGEDKENNYFSLYENGTIGHRNFTSGADGYRAYYKWKDGSLQFIEALITKGGKEFYSQEGITAENASDVSGEDVWSQLKEKGYVGKDILFTPFIEIGDCSDFADNENWTYEELEGKEFWFYSGAGAWETSLKIHGDGTFIGEYEDADVDSLRKCSFSGSFSELRKTGPYEYTMKCKDLKLSQKPGTEGGIENGRRIYYSAPYGFDDAEEFKVYLPGKKVSELPYGFLSWSHGEASTGYLQCYGIYNVGGEQGFVEMDLDEDYEQ